MDKQYMILCCICFLTLFKISLQEEDGFKALPPLDDLEEDFDFDVNIKTKTTENRPQPVTNPIENSDSGDKPDPLPNLDEDDLLAEKDSEESNTQTTDDPDDVVHSEDEYDDEDEDDSAITDGNKKINNPTNTNVTNNNNNKGLTTVSSDNNEIIPEEKVTVSKAATVTEPNQLPVDKDEDSVKSQPSTLDKNKIDNQSNLKVKLLPELDDIFEEEEHGFSEKQREGEDRSNKDARADEDTEISDMHYMDRDGNEAEEEGDYDPFDKNTFNDNKDTVYYHGNEEEKPEGQEESHDNDEDYDSEKWKKQGSKNKEDANADETVDDFEEEELNQQKAKYSKNPPAPSSMVLLYTWMIVAILIVVVGISTYQSRCKGFKIPFFSKKSCHGDDKKRLLDHEFV